MSGTIYKHRQDWEELGSSDPFWAVLSDPKLKHTGWNLEEFFLTGVQEIESLMQQASQIGLPLSRGKVLDFGCGVGRLAPAFSKFFDEYYGVDISESMVDKAKEIIGEKNCNFVLNASNSLQIFPESYFDLIYTNIVLQHLPEKNLIFSYLGEFLRILKDDGLLVFQLPSNILLKKRIKAQIRLKLHKLSKVTHLERSAIAIKMKLHPMRMSSIPEKEVRDFLEKNGGIVLQCKKSWDANSEAVSSFYFVAKGPQTP